MKRPHWRTPAIDRFEASYIPEPNGGCWIWERTIAKVAGGDRAKIVVDGKSVVAHRYAYRTFVGPIPDGLLICHTCDNSICVNPSHLYAGTHKQNSADMVRAGRHVSQKPGGREILIERLKPIWAARRNKNTCKRGHLLEGNNLVVRWGKRSCRECNRTRQRLAARVKRAAARTEASHV